MSKSSEKRLKSLREGTRVRENPGPHWHRIVDWLNRTPEISFGARDDLEDIVAGAYDDGVQEQIAVNINLTAKVTTLEAALREIQGGFRKGHLIYVIADRALTPTEETPDDWKCPECGSDSDGCYCGYGKDGEGK